MGLEEAKESQENTIRAKEVNMKQKLLNALTKSTKAVILLACVTGVLGDLPLKVIICPD